MKTVGVWKPFPKTKPPRRKFWKMYLCWIGYGYPTMLMWKGKEWDNQLISFQVRFWAEVNDPEQRKAPGPSDR